MNAPRNIGDIYLPDGSGQTFYRDGFALIVEERRQRDHGR